MAAEPEPRRSITKVWAKNFRSIEYAELELDPLTVLVGPNASGKSNLLDMLGLLADAVRDGLETAITRRGGIDSIGRRSPTGRVLGPEIGFQFENLTATLKYSVALVRRGKGEFRVRREVASVEPIDSRVGPCEIEFKNGRLTKPNVREVLERSERGHNGDGRDPSAIFRIINRSIERSAGQHLRLVSSEPLESPWWLSLLTSRRSPIEVGSYDRLYLALKNATDYLGKVGLYHIFPNSLRDPQKMADSHPLAAGGGNLASILRDMVQKKGRFLPDLKDALNFAVPGLQDIRVTRAGSYLVVELSHKTDGGTERGMWFDLSQESDGTIRLLAMLTGLFQDPAPSLLGLEEPELAIHPGAMAVLADTMKEAALRGEVLVATHSPDLINLLPIESIRAVTAENGSTEVGRVAEHQMKSVRDKLFLPGELHSMEGLQPVGTR